MAKPQRVAGQATLPSIRADTYVQWVLTYLKCPLYRSRTVFDTLHCQYACEETVQTRSKQCALYVQLTLFSFGRPRINTQGTRIPLRLLDTHISKQNSLC